MLTRAAKRREGEAGYVVVEEHLHGHTIRGMHVCVRENGVVHEFKIWWQQPLDANEADQRFSATRMPRNRAVAALVANTLFKGDLLVMKEGKRQNYVHLRSKADKLLAYKAVKWYVLMHTPGSD